MAAAAAKKKGMRAQAAAVVWGSPCLAAMLTQEGLSLLAVPRSAPCSSRSLMIDMSAALAQPRKVRTEPQSREFSPESAHAEECVCVCVGGEQKQQHLAVGGSLSVSRFPQEDAARASAFAASSPPRCAAKDSGTSPSCCALASAPARRSRFTTPGIPFWIAKISGVPPASADNSGVQSSRPNISLTTKVCGVRGVHRRKSER